MIKKLQKEEFVWEGFQKSIYYWRVAAGQESGRMGLFNEVSKVDLSQVGNTDIQGLAPEVSYLVSKPEEKFKPPVVFHKQELIPPSPLKPSPPVMQKLAQKPAQRQKPARRREYAYLFTFSPKHTIRQQKNKEQVEAQFEGCSLTSMAMAMAMAMATVIHWSLKTRGQLTYHLHFSSVNWEPKNSPAQKNFTSWSAHTRLMHFLPQKNGAME